VYCRVYLDSAAAAAADPYAGYRSTGVYFRVSADMPTEAAYLAHINSSRRSSSDNTAVVDAAAVAAAAAAAAGARPLSYKSSASAAAGVDGVKRLPLPAGVTAPEDVLLHVSGTSYIHNIWESLRTDSSYACRKLLVHAILLNSASQ
jgi:hypothetical protein